MMSCKWRLGAPEHPTEAAVSSRSRGEAQPRGGKALVFQHITAGQGRPAHTSAPSALKPEAGACEGLV